MLKLFDTVANLKPIPVDQLIDQLTLLESEYLNIQTLLYAIVAGRPIPD